MVEAMSTDDPATPQTPAPADPETALPAATEGAEGADEYDPPGLDSTVDFDPLGLDELRATVRYPQDIFSEGLTQRLAEVGPATGSLGRLAGIAGWFAAAQAQCPPRQIERARLVVFAADHGIAAAGVSVLPAGSAAEQMAELVSGSTPMSVLADTAGVSVRVIDVGSSSGPVPGSEDRRVRPGSGRIDREDALSTEQTHEAFRVGRQIAEAEADAGCDLLLAGQLGAGSSTVAAVLVGTSLSLEPSTVTGRGSGVDDASWMRKIVAVRDGLRRARPNRFDPIELLRIAGGTDLAALTGFLVTAAARQVPVLLDGVGPIAAAMIARDICYDASSWWLAAQRSGEPAASASLESMSLDPLLDLGVDIGQGAGGLLAVPLIRAAIALTAALPRWEPEPEDES